MSYILFYTVVFLAVSVLAFRSLPRILMKLVCLHPMIGFLFNFAISWMIQTFLSRDSRTGVAQWTASVAFAIYIWLIDRYEVLTPEKLKKGEIEEDIHGLWGKIKSKFREVI